MTARSTSAVMVTNTGKPSEQEFEDAWKKLGKRAWVYRVTDAAEVRGRTGKAGTTRPAPSDFIVTNNGTHYAEVKSTQDPTAFRFGLLRPKPSAMATMIIAAGGTYFVYVHRLLTNTWFRVPYELINQTKDAGSSSIKWTALEKFAWTLPNTTT